MHTRRLKIREGEKSQREKESIKIKPEKERRNELQLILKMKSLEVQTLGGIRGNIGIFGLKTPLHAYGEHTSMKNEL